VLVTIFDEPLAAESLRLATNCGPAAFASRCIPSR
jgi:hypothetical protein